MPRAYSPARRERALAAYEAGEGRQSEIARLYRIGERTLSSWLKLAREEGRRSPKPRRGGRAPLGGEREARAGLGAERNAASLAGYADLLAERTGVRRSASALCRALKALGLVRKKRRSRPPSRIGRTWPRRGGGGATSGPGAGGVGREGLAGTAPARLVFIDETGIDTRMTRPYARAARGQRAVGKVPRGRWERLTVLGALALDGTGASRGVAAATGTAVFLAFAEEVLIPALRERPDALVVMDNLGAHKAEAVRGALDRAGLAHRYLPSYSPDLNPIERAWSKLKTRLRAVGARSKEALEQALGPALATITAQDARGWFRLARRPPPQWPAIPSSPTAGVQGSVFDAASGSGGRAAGGVVASATRRARPRDRGCAPRAGARAAGAPPARSAAAGPRPGGAVALPPPATLRTAAR